MSFKLTVLKGAHRSKRVVDETGRVIVKGRTYKIGETFESDVDLSKREPNRFQRVGGAGPSDVEGLEDFDDLTKLNTPALMKLALGLGIDLMGATKKKDMLEVIQAALSKSEEVETEEQEEDSDEEE